MILKRSLLILFGVVLCFCLEMAARLVLPETKLNLMESIHTVCCEDNELLWRQKENLDTIFQGKHVITNSLGLRNDEILLTKKADKTRLICLGGSSTFGWGVDRDKTYPMCLQRLINNLSDKIALEVINAGQIGYTSYQGKIFLEKYLLDYNPDIITVSYVLNDIDKVRFFKNKKLSDSQAALSVKDEILFKRYIVDKRIYFLAKRFVSWLIQKNKKLSAAVYRNHYENSEMRVSAEEYKHNLEYIISICRAKNIKLVFIIMPINLSLPDSVGQENGSFLSREYYLKAKKYEQIKDYKNAEFFYKKALDYQVFICKKNGVLFHSIMAQAAKENNIPLVNAELLFDTYQKANGGSLFNGPDDRIHPNDLGHRIIADALKECIETNAMLFTQKNYREM